MSTASVAFSTAIAVSSTVFSVAASCDPPQAASVIRPAAAITNVSFFTQTSQPCWQDGGCHLQRQNLAGIVHRSEEHTSELQSLMRISYAVFCLKTTQNKPNEIYQNKLETYKKN